MPSEGINPSTIVRVYEQPLGLVERYRLNRYDKSQIDLNALIYTKYCRLRGLSISDCQSFCAAERTLALSEFGEEDELEIEYPDNRTPDHFVTEDRIVFYANPQVENLVGTPRLVRGIVTMVSGGMVEFCASEPWHCSELLVARSGGQYSTDENGEIVCEDYMRGRGGVANFQDVDVMQQFELEYLIRNPGHVEKYVGGFESCSQERRDLANLIFNAGQQN